MIRWRTHLSSRSLAALFGLLLMLGAAPAYPGCSPYVGLATLNEYYHSSQSPTGAKEYFIETKLLASSMRSKYKDWTIMICSQVAADNLADTCITADQTLASSFADTAYDADLALSNASGGDWLVLDQSAGADGYPAGYIDNNGGSGHGMEVFLLDANGDVIDYTSVSGYSVHAADLGVSSCSFLYDNTYSGSNTFTMQRLPDGMGCWPEDTASTSDTTVNGTTISCIGATPPSGSSGSPTESVPNTETTTTGTYPTIALQSTSVLPGGIATFTITVTGAVVITKSQGDLVYSFDPTVTTTNTDIPISITTMDGTVTAPPPDVSSVILPAGSGSVSFTVDTSTISPLPAEGDYFYAVIASTTGAIITTPYGQALFIAPLLDHLAISPQSATASTCLPTIVSISARNASNGLVSDYSGTITLTTSTNHGTWLSTTGAGSFIPGGSDTGSASYTFDPADGGSVNFELANSHSETLTITVSDAAEPLSASSGDYTYSDNMFVVKDDGIRVAGRPISITVEYWTMERDASGNPILDANGYPLGCSLVSGYNSGAQGLKAYITPSAGDHPAGAIPPQIGGATLPTSLPAANNVTLDFSAGGTASLALDTFDVGKYTLTLVDDNRAYAADRDISGSTAVMTVNPFALDLRVYDGAGNDNPGGSATTGVKFIAAATPFNTDIRGILWELADDAGNDGIPDSGANLSNNGVAPAFAWPVTLSEQAPYTPAAPAVQALSGTLAVPATSFSTGSATVSDLKYAEVGSFSLAVSAIDYLNSAGNTLSSAQTPVGRFYPAYLTLSGASITPACGNFTYMGQNLSLNASAEAWNADGIKVALYDNSTLGYAYTASLSLAAENDDDGINLAAPAVGRLSAGTGLGWSSGTATIDITNLQLRRGSTPDHLAAVQLGGNFTAPDGEQLQTSVLNMNPTTTGVCGAACSHLALATLGDTLDFRFGRMVLDDAFGPETQPLTIPLRAEFYDASTLGFRTNGDDNCSTYNSANATLLNPTGALPAAAAIIATPGDVTLSGGLYDPATPLAISAPGTGNTGTIDITLDLAAQPWLQFDWLNVPAIGPYTNNPTATATFGSYRGNDHVIFWREVFN